MSDERATRGVEHLQAAALEMIAAARAFLDVAEDLVADKEKVADVVAAMGEMADTVKVAAGGMVRGKTAHTSTAAADPPDEGVQRIPVS